MNKYYFSINLSYERFLPFYQGVVDTVQVVDDANRRIDLPAKHFRQYLTRDGIVGRFELITQTDGKFIALNRIF
ncbi:DUF2835 domain-containing protein [Psychrobium sp. MM17-31]|uniref:DUF2835 family protein n=1 Tax=Psychrobium sp. MM17-31 TaxID=2917758 RepID=UPI001EF57637|nr:DUF2835 family protein [Psychrobium sp. MM17-31]MCG7529792.1 DUF2835 domain-containing protein [Psychrobium sp. MM17-31]